MQTPKISEMGITRKMDPYATTQKLDYIDINQVSSLKKLAIQIKNDSMFIRLL